MKIYSVFDSEFQMYGQVVNGLDEAAQEIGSILSTIPLTEDVAYSPEYLPLQELPAMVEIREHCFGGMPIQLGCCYGFNSRLNCLEYHRNSEFNLSPEDFILLLARRDEIKNGFLDTAKVKAFRVPAGTMIEIFATTLHYAPCHCNPGKGFRVLVALPQGTNTVISEISDITWEDKLLWAQNKWLIAHPDSQEAQLGAYIGLSGENICINHFTCENYATQREGQSQFVSQA